MLVSAHYIDIRQRTKFQTRGLYMYTRIKQNNYFSIITEQHRIAMFHY